MKKVVDWVAIIIGVVGFALALAGAILTFIPDQDTIGGILLSTGMYPYLFAVGVVTARVWK